MNCIHHSNTLLCGTIVVETALGLNPAVSATTLGDFGHTGASL